METWIYAMSVVAFFVLCWFISGVEVALLRIARALEARKEEA